MKPFELSGYLPTIRLSHDLELPTYFVVISLALCICVYWIAKRADNRALSKNTALDLALVTMTFGFLGARLFHVFIEEPQYYLEDLSRVLEFWRGGFVWYGGVVLGSVAGVAFAKWKKLNIPIWLDLFTPLLAFGYAFGRFACVLTGCCYGDVCELANGILFRYPTQAFAMIWEFGVLAFLLRFEKKSRHFGTLFYSWVLLHGIGRLIMEAFRADPRGPAPLGLSVSSWISISLILSASAAMAFTFRKKQ